MRHFFRLLPFLLCAAADTVYAAEPQIVRIAYLAQEKTPPPVLSNMDPFVKDAGMQGALLAIKDNNTTGRFTGQRFELQVVTVPPDGDVQAAFNGIAAKDYRLIVANLPSQTVRTLAATESGSQMLWFDAASRDDADEKQCFGNILHMLPSRAMRADALAQYLLKKRWKKWFLAVGQTEEDKLFAQALKRAAQRFGMEIVADKNWTHSFQERRTDEAEVAVFTQQADTPAPTEGNKLSHWLHTFKSRFAGDGDDYDVVVLADEQGLFGEYFSYRTWLPRPVAGTHGLVPSSWHEAHEAWGAVQLQNRFREQAGRWMKEEDYGAYLALRSIGEAATRTQSPDMPKIRAYLLSPQFTLQGYKGKPLSFRPWNGQLRQPVLLAAPRSVVAVPPLEGFLHPRNELDTLGYDKPEINCP
jgi:ABC-type branched-subunit amino acid transport system substrate-binding protein